MVWHGQLAESRAQRRLAGDREVAAATTNPTTVSGFPSEEELFEPPVRSGAFTAKKVILGRRSAVSMDASTAISAATFFRMLARLVPTRDGRSVPWDAGAHGS